MRRSQPPDERIGHRGRVFGHGELPLVVLALLERAPMHPYEVLAELTGMFEGRYVPSPGSVYPAVSALAEQKLVQGRGEGRRTVYGLTARGRAALDHRRGELHQIERRVGVAFSDRASLDVLLDSFTADVKGIVPCPRVAFVETVLLEAVSRLRNHDQGRNTHASR